MIWLYTCRLESRWVFYMSTLTTLHWGWSSWSNTPKSLIKLSTPRRKKKYFASSQNHWTLRLLRINICSSCSISFSSGVSSFYIFHHLSTRFISLSWYQTMIHNSKQTHPYSAAEPTHIWAEPPLMDHVRDVQGMITLTRKIEIDPVAAGYGDLICWYQQVDVPAALIQRFKSYHFVTMHLPIRVADYISFNWKWITSSISALGTWRQKKSHNKFGPSQSPVELGSCRPQKCTRIPCVN